MGLVTEPGGTGVHLVTWMFHLEPISGAEHSETPGPFASDSGTGPAGPPGEDDFIRTFGGPSRVWPQI